MNMSSKSLPSIITPDFLESLKNHPLASIRNTWYFIVAVTVTVLNRPDEVAKIYQYAIGFEADHSISESSKEEKLRISRRIREALIKTSPVAGVPKIINALMALKGVTPIEFQDQPPQESPTSRHSDAYGLSSTQILDRGQAFFEKIYGKVSERVMGQMETSGTEDLGLIAKLLYGHILSNTTILNEFETSFVMISAIIPQDTNPQLRGHLRGALNGGASVEDVRAVRDIVIKVCESAGMTTLDPSAVSGWGWREEIANI